jgi:hypothetical protein
MSKIGVWSILKWTWRVARNLLYLALVWYVLSQLRGRPETVIVPILGLLYVGIRVVGIGVAYGLLQQGRGLAVLEAQVRGITNPNYRQHELNDLLEKQSLPLYADIFLESTFLTLISLLCAVYLFTAI